MRGKQSLFPAAVVVAIGLTACGKRKQAASPAGEDAGGAVVDRDAAARAAPAAPAAPEAGPYWKDRPEPALRALGLALEQLSTDEVTEWLEKRELPRPDDVPAEEPPGSVRAAVDALVAWDGAGATAPMPCVKGMNNPIASRVLMTAKAAFELSSGPADVPAHAALRLGVALRADENNSMAMLIGAAMPKEAAKAFARRDITAPVPATAPVKAFWAETIEQAAAAKTRAELAAVLERRIDEAREERPRSMMVPLLGAPFAAKMLLRDDESE